MHAHSAFSFSRSGRTSAGLDAAPTTSVPPGTSFRSKITVRTGTGVGAGVASGGGFQPGGVRVGVGAGAGVSATLILSQLLLVTPAGKVWIPVLLVPAGAAFLLGWFSPGPLADDDDEEQIEDWMRETVFDPGAKEQGQA